ncbi:MAG: 30S ribosome-binding factor RbfA [Thermoleophilia bacterium]
MAGQRIRRVNEAIREVLSEAIAGGLKDPRIGFVTIVSVDTAADMRTAKVYVSVLGDAEARRETMAGLEHSHGFLQSLLAGQLSLRCTPRLTFQYDESIELGLRMEELLKQNEPD